MVNLFWLSPPRYVRGRGLNYSRCARQHIDAHIIKIPLEAAQLLYAAHHALPTADDWRARAPMAGTGERGYRPTHMNNPISKWVRENAAHYRHAVAYGLALCEEYSHRYGREHACEAHLHWLQGNEPAIPNTTHDDRREGEADDDEEEDELARFKIARAPPCAMPEEFKVALAEDSAGGEAKEQSGGLSSAADDRSHHERQGDRSEKKSEEDAGVDARHAIAEAESAKGRRPEAVGSPVKAVEQQTSQQGQLAIKATTPETTVDDATSTAPALERTEERAERADSLLLPIQDEVAASSQVAFPLHVYQSYRAYYLGQKLSLKMSTFKTRDVPHWAQERVLEIRALPKAAATTKAATAKRKREQAATTQDDGEEDYTKGRRLTRSHSRARKLASERDRDEGDQKQKQKKTRTKKDAETEEDEGDDTRQKKKTTRKRNAEKAPAPVVEESAKGSGSAGPSVRRSPRKIKKAPSSSSSVVADDAQSSLTKRRKVAPKKEIK